MLCSCATVPEVLGLGSNTDAFTEMIFVVTEKYFAELNRWSIALKTWLFTLSVQRSLISPSDMIF